MFTPMTVAFEIKSPIKDKRGIKKTLITIWHVDPCKDGTDDSCGWFMRSRHGSIETLKKIQNEFDFNFKNKYKLNKAGYPIFSTIGTLVQMYSVATWIYFNRNRRKQNKFMRKYLLDIIKFAENPLDCGGDAITNKWKYENKEEIFNSMAAMVYSDILKKQRKWWRHPKWHVSHWRIQLVFLRKNKKQ